MEKLFQYINLFPMPLWLAMMFAPNHPITQRASRSSTLFIIAALHYVLALLQAARPKPGAPPAKMDFTTLNGISQGLGTPEGALAGWSHMLALDLFTGAWIYRQSQALSAPAWVRIPALGFTLMTGPFGLLLFLGWRLLVAKQSESI